MTKGFLIVDQAMNTVIVPQDDEDLIQWMKYKVNVAKAHEHKTLKELDKDIRAYLHNEYEQEDE